MKIRFKLLLFCLCASSLISCDQITKSLAREHLKFGPSISYFHDTFRLQYAENTGAALSLGDNLPKVLNLWLLGIVPSVFMAGLLYYTLKNMSQLNNLRLAGFTLVLAGGVGNLIDRLLRDRHVIDFMKFGINQLRTGIFNVADLCISFGVIMLIISYSKDTQPLLKSE